MGVSVRVGVCVGVSTMLATCIGVATALATGTDVVAEGRIPQADTTTNIMSIARTILIFMEDSFTSQKSPIDCNPVWKHGQGESKGIRF